MELDKHGEGGGGANYYFSIFIHYIYSGTGVAPIYCVIVDGLYNGLNGLRQSYLIVKLL